MFPVLSHPGRRPMHMHFVVKVRMWLPFFNTPGKPGSWNPVCVFEGARFYVHLQMFPVFRIACLDIQKLSFLCTLSSKTWFLESCLCICKIMFQNNAKLLLNWSRHAIAACCEQVAASHSEGCQTNSIANAIAACNAQVAALS